ncbi:MAG: glycosyltransferase, partial [Candidatus Aenigmarchaeota archaeon]|nr:glycosyltransferase [Candidatus Aenigmarchaeota archaeon]MDW8149092.1 glycosyltransferase [Candidatus Aenigmarchaeota archaeon]
YQNFPRRMKITLVSRSFNKNSGQGIYKMCGYLFDSLKIYSNFEIKKIESKDRNYFYFDLIKSIYKVLRSDSSVYHFLMPEVSLSLLISDKIRRRSVATIHDTIVYKIKERKTLSEKYIKFMYNVAKRARFIHTPSLQSKNDIVEFLKVEEEKIVTIQWGIDLDFFKPLRKRRDGTFVCGYLGGLGKRKNVEWILYLARYFKDFKFKIAGSGPQLEKLKIIKKTLDLENVELIGFVPEDKLPEFYNSLDILIFPSLYEGFGIPLLEAMACEVPYVIGTSAGIGNVLPIYKINSFEELREIIAKIKNNELKPLKSLRKWIAKNKFTWKDSVNKLIKLYEEVMK